MEVKFLQERMTFLPTPRTYKDLLKMVGKDYDRESLKDAFLHYLNDSIPGTQKFMGGGGWLVLMSVRAVFDGNVYIEICSARIKNNEWDFLFASSAFLTDTERNREELSKTLRSIAKVLSSCNSEEEVFHKIEKIGNNKRLWA